MTTARKVAVVDADPQRRAALAQAVRSAGHEVVEFADAAETLRALEQIECDVVIAEAHLPQIDGAQFVTRVAAHGGDVPVVIVTAPGDTLAGIECLKAGAADYLSRPFDREDLLLRMERAVERHWLLQEGRSFRQQLEARIGQHSHDLRRMFLAAVESLASALEARDPNTRGHSTRVADLATALALPLRLSETQRERLRVAAQLHDIGKLGIPDDVLKKPGRLTRPERAQIQMHPLIAVGILSPLLADAETVAMIRHHHERIDGSGYPDGLRGDDIPLGARILAAADTFDAMTSKRPYRPAYPREAALAEMRHYAGLQLDTGVVQALCILMLGRSNNRNRDKPEDSNTAT